MCKLAFLLFLSTVGGSAAAQPLKIASRTDVPAPGRPTLTLSAEEPVRDVVVTLRPAPAPAEEPGAGTPETAPVVLRVGALPAGAQRTLPIGTGRIGCTQWSGAVQWRRDGQIGSTEITLKTLVIPSLTLRYDPSGREHLSLKERWVEVQLSRTASRGEVRVIADSGAEIGLGQASFGKAPPGTWLRIPWTEQAPGNVLRLEVKVFDESGFWKSISLWPWSVPVPHQEVRFATGSAEIQPGERGKIDESARQVAAILQQVRDKLQPPQTAKLYVVGHTDTVDTDAYNMNLSRDRARAIAAALRGAGLAIPIFYAGCGERALRVQTADNVDEERNRRADYLLAVEPPPLCRGAGWQRLP